MSVIHWLLNLICGKAEEINGANRCPTYLYRWTLLKYNKRGIYLHHFVGDDWSLDLHDHPKRFISIGLWGEYIETTPCPDNFPNCDHYHIWRAPWYRSFSAEHQHRLSVPSKNCWTLVCVGDATRPWGFWHNGEFVGWRKYVNSPEADERKAC